MEFRVDITGDTSGADKGAAALRAEAAAARNATEELEKLQKAHRDVGAPAPVAPAKPAPTAKGPEKPVSPFSNAKHEDDWKPSPWAQETAGAKAAAEAAKGVAAQQTKGGQEAAKAGEKSVKATAKTADGARNAALGIADFAKGSIAAAAALAGIQSLGDLSKLAIGWRGMAQLQMISYRAQMDIRRLVQGTDAQPLIRATAALEKNLSKNTVTGDALSGILKRGFDGAFGAIEKLEPIAEAVFQGMVLGALEAEIGYQNVRATLAPLTVLLEDALAGTNAMGDAANEASGFFRDTRAEVEGIAKAVAAVAEGVKAWNQGTWGTNVKEKLGITSAPDAAKERLAAGAAASSDPGSYFNSAKFKAEQAGPARPGVEAGGQDTGKAIADGMVKGMSAGSDAVHAAGQDLGKTAVAGANTGAEVHSPSKATGRTAGFMIDGAVDELDRGAPDVARAAERAFTPPAATGATKGAGASASPGTGVTVASMTVGPFTFGDSVPRDLQADAEAAVRKGVRAALIKLGIPIPGGP